MVHLTVESTVLTYAYTCNMRMCAFMHSEKNFFQNKGDPNLKTLRVLYCDAGGRYSHMCGCFNEILLRRVHSLTNIPARRNVVFRWSPCFVYATGVSGLGGGASSSHGLSFSNWRDLRTRLILFYNLQRLPNITKPPQSSLPLSLNGYETAVYARPIHYAALFVILVKAATLY